MGLGLFVLKIFSTFCIYTLHKNTLIINVMYYDKLLDIALNMLRTKIEMLQDVNASKSKFVVDHTKFYQSLM